MSEFHIWFPVAFFVIALFYAMVGFGGGSSYLAVLVLAGFNYQQIPMIALGCNLIVTLGGCWHFYKAGHFKLKVILPFVVTSIPMAYWGGRIDISQQFFCLLLGLSLLFVAIRMFMNFNSSQEVKEISWKKAWLVGIPVGSGLGFLAGLVGIGGGIFLSPLLILLRWVNIKQAAAAASFFIVVNSLAGLTGHLHKDFGSINFFLPLAAAVFIGGQVGSRLGAYKIPKHRLQQLLGVLILYVAFKLLFEGL